VDTLLNNAVQSIQIGIEDLGSLDPRRALSAVRNVYAGIVLLLKEELRRRSPHGSNDALIRANIRFEQQSDGPLRVVGRGRKTVDLAQIRERLTSIGTPLTVEQSKRLWADLDKFSALRNDIEHYRIDARKEEVNAVIAIATALIRPIVADLLKEDPQTLLGDDCWTTMLKTAEVYAEQKAVCERTLAGVRWNTAGLSAAIPFLRCGHCESDLISQNYPDNVWQESVIFHCAACGAEDSVDDAEWLMTAVLEAKGIDPYYDPSDPDGAPTATCPECDHDSVVVEEASCTLCGWEHSGECCAVCGGPVSFEDEPSTRVYATIISI
jgi:hypothetical protein